MYMPKSTIPTPKASLESITLNPFKSIIELLSVWWIQIPVLLARALPYLTQTNKSHLILTMDHSHNHLSPPCLPFPMMQMNHDLNLILYPFPQHTRTIVPYHPAPRAPWPTKVDVISQKLFCSFYPAQTGITSSPETPVKSSTKIL